MTHASVEQTGTFPLSQTVSWRQSLRWRLLILLSIILLGTLLLIGASVASFVFLTEQQAWQGRQAEAARNAGETVSTFIVNVEDTLTVISLLDREATDVRTLQDILQHNPALLEVIRVNSRGEIFANADRDASVLSNIFTISQSQWFLQATSGKEYISNVQISSTDEPYLIIAVPAPDGGAVAARLRMTVLWEVVGNLRFGQTGRAYVINNDGQIVGHTDPEVALANTTINGRPESKAALYAPDNIWNGSYVNFEGVSVVGATAPVPKTDWVVITELTRSEAFTVTRTAIFLVGGGLLLFGLLVIAVTMPQLRRVVLNPMEQLRSGARRIGRGDLSHRITIPRQDEIGQVAEAFNEMAGRLQTHEKELIVARDQALAANNFKSELLAKVSHELRTPLNAILGYSELLQEGFYDPISSKQQSPTEKIINSTKYLTSLVGELLDQARLDAGKLDLHLVAFNPAELVDQVQSQMDILAKNKGLILETNFDSDLPPMVQGDPTRVQQILVNLISNAIKFTSAGQIKVCIQKPDLEHWSIQVSDTGVGIPKNAHSDIFEPFKQVDGTVTRRHSGTGLGLSITKQLTLLMGGEISLVSELGQGSTFTVLLPQRMVREQVG